MHRSPPRNFKPVPYAYHEEIELRIDTLTNLGVGLGRIDGWVVMVPYTLPGERVRARVWRNKSNFSDADLVAVLEPSPDRVEAACPLFGECGGCQYQHLAYPAQLAWKTRQIHELLTRLGKLSVEVQPCIGSPKQWGYRSKITPHFDRPPRGEATIIGFQRAESRSLVDVPACPIASPAINESLSRERAAVKSGTRQYKKGATLLFRDTPDGVETDSRAVVRERIGDRIFEFVAGEFFQTNPHILPHMVDYVLGEAAGEGDCAHLVDTYCGVGVFALCGADRFSSVLGIEVNTRAFALAQSNLALNGITNTRFIEGSAEAIFADCPFPGEASAVIIDPPRKGCSPEFLEQLIAFGPRRVVYVSCGPDTQARDLRILADAGFVVTRVQPFDLFPHTRHIENVATLERSCASPSPV